MRSGRCCAALCWRRDRNTSLPICLHHVTAMIRIHKSEVSNTNVSRWKASGGRCKPKPRRPNSGEGYRSIHCRHRDCVAHQHVVHPDIDYYLLNRDRAGRKGHTVPALTDREVPQFELRTVNFPCGYGSIPSSWPRAPWVRSILALRAKSAGCPERKLSRAGLSNLRFW